MSQNIYDNPTFFTQYAALPRSRDGLSAAPEWPSLQRMLPPLEGTTVLDLGCGYGWFCAWASTAGASAVLGIDISAAMLARAAALHPAPTITYEQHDICAVAPEPARYHVVYSSLTLHYLPDIEGLFARVFAGLAPGGRFVFSCEHPVWTAVDGWFVECEGASVWPLRGYADEGRKVKSWLGSGVVKYHRRLDTYVGALLRAGFVLRDLVEWMPSREDLKEHPDWEMEVHRPAFLLVAAQRPEA